MPGKTQLQKDIPSMKLFALRKQVLAEVTKGNIEIKDEITTGYNNKNMPIWANFKDANNRNVSLYTTAEGMYTIFSKKGEDAKAAIEFTDMGGKTYRYQDTDQNGLMDMMTLGSQPNVAYGKTDQSSSNYDVRATGDFKSGAIKYEYYNPQTGQYEPRVSIGERVKGWFK